MRPSEPNEAQSGTRISVSIPAQNPDLYSRAATDSVLTFLSRRPYQTFTQREIADHVEYSESAVRGAVDHLADNELVEREPEGNRNSVRINRRRLEIPDDPILRIPQSEFHEPVRVALDEVTDRLSGVIGVVLHGSVSRGEGDRRSDIDLWVLVTEERAANQRRATAIKKELEDRRFDGERHVFHISVESVRAAPNFADSVADIVASGIVLYEDDEFRKFEEAILRLDERDRSE